MAGGGHGSRSSSSTHPQPVAPGPGHDRYRSPLSADDMLAHATSFLASRQQPNPKLLRPLGDPYIDSDVVDRVAREVRAACPRLQQVNEACMRGVALALLPLRGTNTAKNKLVVNSDDAAEQAVAAFYAALHMDGCRVQSLTIRGAAFGTPAAATHLGRCLSLNSTLQTLVIGVDGFWHQAVWTAFWDALTSNATIQSLHLESPLNAPTNGGHLGFALADCHKLAALRHLRIDEPEWLTSWDSLEQPALTAASEGGATQGWCTMLQRNSTVTRLQLRSTSQQCALVLMAVCEALHTNTVLQELIIDCSELSARFAPQALADKDAQALAAMLRSNSTLKMLDIGVSGLKCNAMVIQGLSRNSTLERLRVVVDSTVAAQDLMTALTPTEQAPGRGSQLQELDLGHTAQCFPTSSALGDMLTSNRTLLSLHLRSAPYTKEEWAKTIIPALANNCCLQELDLEACPGVDAELVHDALLELLKDNKEITSIKLEGTPLHKEGKAEIVGNEVTANGEYMAVLNKLPATLITSCRLVLCGYPFAGKTTLLQTMMRRHLSSPGSRSGGGRRHSSAQQTRDSSSPAGTSVWSRFKATWQSDKAGVIRRTRGIDIQHFHVDNLIMWVWDFAGQREFHPMQDFIFPTGGRVHAATAFIFTFNPLQEDVHTGKSTTSTSGSKQIHFKEERHFEQEFSYWLKFICSNTKPRPTSANKPRVLVVVTRKDKFVTRAKWEAVRTEANFKEWVRNVAHEFKDMVSLDVDNNVFFLNATDKHDRQVASFEDHAIKALRNRISNVHEVPVICDAVARALGGGSQGEEQRPIISMAKFQSLCESKAKELNDRLIKSCNSEPEQKMRRALLEMQNLFSRSKDQACQSVAAYLRDTGVVLYFKDLDFIVTNPRWFSHAILGHLIDIFSPVSCDLDRSSGANPDTHQVPSDDMVKDGLVSEDFLAELVGKAAKIVGSCPLGAYTDQLILLMDRLHLSYQVDSKFLIPTLFRDDGGRAEKGERKREWTLDIPALATRCIFVTRRLQCSDCRRTFITPGFFPRLQVVLKKESTNWYKGIKCTCELEKCFCRLVVDGMEILVEHSGSYDYFVDIMVKSYKSPQDTEEFLRSAIMHQIRKMCASLKGCQGVTLVEAVLRPDCVGKDITLCRYRQSIPIADLEQRMIRVPVYEHYWERVVDGHGNTVLSAALHSSQHLLHGAPGTNPSPGDSQAARHYSRDCYPDVNLRLGEKRGLAVIVSMERTRPGGSLDRVKLEDLCRRLGFRVEPNHIMVDFTVEDVRLRLKQIAEEEILENDECFACFLNGHGGSTDDEKELHYILDHKGDMLFLDYAMKPFRTCEHLQGKPKVFFVNTCRGNDMPLVQAQPGTTIQQPSSEQPRREGSEYRYLQECTDGLIMFSTFGRCVSTRYPAEGSSFVCALVAAFDAERQTTDVVGIMCCVIRRVADEGHKFPKKKKADEGHNVDKPDVTGALFGQCPVYVSSLTKLLYWRDIE